MGITLNRVLNSLKNSTPSSGVEKALIHIAGGIDNLNDLITDSHDIQMAESRADDLGDKKARALMIVIEKMIANYNNHQIGDSNYNKIMRLEMFRLFEKVKSVKRAENETEFRSAIADL